MSLSIANITASQMTVTNALAFAAHAGGADDSLTASSGPIEWLAAQYDRHGQQVYSLAFHIVKDQAEAEAVVVEAFLALHRAGRPADAIEDHLLRWTQDMAVLRVNSRSSRS